MEVIVVDFDVQCFLLYVVIQNWEYDFNIGLVVCIVNVFNVVVVYILGWCCWNRCGVMVIDWYLYVYYYFDVFFFLYWFDEYGVIFVGVDNLFGLVLLEMVQLLQDCCLVFGLEGFGLIDEVVKGCEQLVVIIQYGLMCFMNVGVVVVIVMYVWMMQWCLKLCIS